MSEGAWLDGGSVPPALDDGRAVEALLSCACLELRAWPGAVPRARRHARQMLWDAGLKELIEPVETVVSEIVTNAIRACGGLDGQDMSDGSAVRLWLAAADEGGVLMLVWDASPSRPERQQPGPDAESGRGLLLVEALATSWGSFGLADRPGKVVWAHCQD
jgi:anti-sigma regulatory factor (Ser/Thr protein kinase)